MKIRAAVPAFAAVLLAACAGSNRATPDEARSFIDTAEQKLLQLGVDSGRADWVKSTYITDDTESMAAKANERSISAAVDYAKQATRFDGLNLDPVTARKIKLLKTSLVIATPSAPKEAEELTKNNDKLTLVVAFNYGARQEIARAAARLAAKVKAGEIDPSEVTADLIGQNLDAPDLPDPDLIIRTSGEQRLSNFLMWQAAYSELVFVPIHWPDFDKAALEGAIAEFARRERRFGGLVAKTAS